MAKSLRARSKVAARNAKRYNDKSDYAVVQAARLAQTSGRLQEKNKHGKTVAEEDADQLEGTQDDEKMAEEPSTTDVTGAETKGWYPFVASSGEHAEDVMWALFGLCDPDDIRAGDDEVAVAKQLERLLS